MLFGEIKVMRLLVLQIFLICAIPHAYAQAPAPFQGGWTLDPIGSDFRVMSIKKTRIAESSEFQTYTGAIAEDGLAQVKVLLDSIDTKIDLRNVRMRFLFFETFKFPEATITTRIDPGILADLVEVKLKYVDLTYELDLHGVTATRTDSVQIALLDNNTVVVSSAKPIPISLADFNLDEGREKLQDAAQVQIVPVGTVSFAFMFRRTTPLAVAATAPKEEPAEPRRNAALESQGAFDRAECSTRFETLSQTGNIYFAAGSADLAPESAPLLEALLDIIVRCPNMRVQVAGHTDSDGSAGQNQQLSEARASAVGAFLFGKGVSKTRISTVGFGETQPIRPNTSADNKRRNRRIEFTIQEG